MYSVRAVKDYYEDLWQGLPERLIPPDLDRRASFLLRHVHAGQAILDLGCGNGVFAELMLEHATVTVTAADVAEAALARARRQARLAQRASFALVPFDGELPFADNHFDLVWASEVIEHVADTGRWLSEVRRVLKPKAELLLTTPNHSRLALATRGIAVFSPPLGDHLHLYNRASLSQLLVEFGFDSVQVRGGGVLALGSRLLLASARR
jgi:ubiquinone/menaquinone biosynthesis C-methylase UbiE